MIKNVLDIISKTENCKILSTEEIKKLYYLKKEKLVIEIDTELSLNNGYMGIKLYVSLRKGELPKIFIDDKNYDVLKYIPHVNSDLSICIEDDENINFSESDLGKLTIYLIHKAKAILSVHETDKENEFEREFRAYWQQSYNTEKIVSEAGMVLINESDKVVKGIKFKTNFNFFKFLIYNENPEAIKLLQYFDENLIKYSEFEVLEVLYDKISPPYDYTFSQSIDLLSDDNLKKFKRIINKNGLTSVLIFFRKNVVEFYGWLYEDFSPAINIEILKGYKYSNWEKIKLPLFKNSTVRRIYFANVEEKRLDKRTANEIINREKNICIIGLGSIGSHILGALTALPINKYKLIDPDYLKVENIQRHKFGFSDINLLKTEIARKFILDKNPFSSVTVNNKSIIDILANDDKFFESDDIIFIAVGVGRLECYILDYLIANNYEKSVVIIWVEAYLATGQIIFTRAKEYVKVKEIIKDFDYHVLDEKVFLKEGSCQTGYIPYSMENINLFVSAIFKVLYKIVKGTENNSVIYSWLGDLELIKEKKLKMSTFAQNRESFSLIKNNI